MNPGPSLPPEGLEPGLAEDLRLIGRVAARLSLRAYLVGGPVRDALLGLPVVDVDVSVEGEARRLAEALAAEVGGDAVEHLEFLTAVVRLADGRHWDLATARRESYPRPGALPVVEPAGIAEDLGRRDFTVNAMALELGAGGPGGLLDPFGGREDLERRILRALHEGSFADDPTRVVRAAVYAERLGLEVEAATAAWMAAALASGALGTVSGARLGEQLRRGIETAAGGRVVLRLAGWGALAALGMPAEARNPAALEGLEAGLGALALPAEACGPAALALAAGGEAPRAAESLALPREYGRLGRRLAEAVAADVPARIAVGEATPGRIEEMLDPPAPALVLALWALVAEDGRRRIEGWWRRRAGVTLEIRGDDLLAAGIRRGPAVGAGLRAAWLALLDGRATKAQAQREVALAAAREALEASAVEDGPEEPEEADEGGWRARSDEQ